MSTRQGYDTTELAWALLTALSEVGDERERARLTATGLPSILPCRLSGVILLDQAENIWSLVAQANGHLLDSSDRRTALAILKPLVLELFRRPQLRVVRLGEGAEQPRISSWMDSLNMPCFAVVPVRTVRSRVGALFLGSERVEGLSPREQTTLIALARQLAIGIENLRLNQKLAEYSQDLEDLVKERTEEPSFWMRSVISRRRSR